MSADTQHPVYSRPIVARHGRASAWLRQYLSDAHDRMVRGLLRQRARERSRTALDMAALDRAAAKRRRQARRRYMQTRRAA